MYNQRKAPMLGRLSKFISTLTMLCIARYKAYLPHPGYHSQQHYASEVQKATSFGSPSRLTLANNIKLNNMSSEGQRLWPIFKAFETHYAMQRNVTDWADPTAAKVLDILTGKLCRVRYTLSYELSLVRRKLCRVPLKLCVQAPKYEVLMNNHLSTRQRAMRTYTRHSTRANNEHMGFGATRCTGVWGVASCESAKTGHDLIDQVSNGGRDNEPYYYHVVQKYSMPCISREKNIMLGRCALSA